MWSKRKEIDVKRGRLITLPAVVTTSSFEQQLHELHESNDQGNERANNSNSNSNSINRNKNKLRNYTTELTVDSDDFNFVTALDYALVIVQDAKSEIEAIGSWLLVREVESVHSSMSDEHKESSAVMEALHTTSEAFTQIEYFFIGTDNGQMYLWPLLPPHFISRLTHEWGYLQKTFNISNNNNNNISSCRANSLPCLPDFNNVKRLVHRHAREEPVIAVQRLGVLVCSISMDGCVAVSRFHPFVAPVTTFQQSRPLRCVCLWEGQIFTSRANATLCGASSQKTPRVGEREIVPTEKKHGKNELMETFEELEEHHEEAEEKQIRCEECNTIINGVTTADIFVDVVNTNIEEKVKHNNESTVEFAENETKPTNAHEMTKSTHCSEYSSTQVKLEPCHEKNTFTTNMANRQGELWNAAMHAVEQRAMYICTGDDAAVVRLWRVDVLSHRATLMHVFVCCPTLTRMHSPLEICHREDTEKLLHARETTMSVHCLCIDADKRLLAGLDDGIYVWALDRLSWHCENEPSDYIAYDNSIDISLTGNTSNSKDHRSDNVKTPNYLPLPDEKSECLEECKESKDGSVTESFSELCGYHVPWESNHHLCWDEERNMPLLGSLQSCAIAENTITKKNLNVNGDNGVNDNFIVAHSSTTSLQTCIFASCSNQQKDDEVTERELRLLQLRASRLINHHVWLAPAKCVESELTKYNTMKKVEDCKVGITSNTKQNVRCNLRKLQASKWKDQYAVKLTDGRAIGVVCNEVQIAHLHKNDNNNDNVINHSSNKMKINQTEQQEVNERGNTVEHNNSNIVNDTTITIRDNIGVNIKNKVNKCEAKSSSSSSSSSSNVECKECNPMHHCLHNSLVTICFDDGETRKDIKLPLSCVAPVVYPLQYMSTAQVACFALLVLSNNEYVLSSGSDGTVRVWKRCKHTCKNGKVCNEYEKYEEEEEEEYVLLFVASHCSALSQSNGMTSAMTRGLGRMLCLLSPRCVFVSCGFDDGLVKEWHLYVEPEELLRCERRFTLQCSSSSSSSSLSICVNSANNHSNNDKNTVIRTTRSETLNNDDINYQVDKENTKNKTNQVNAKQMSTCTRREEDEELKCTNTNKLPSVWEHNKNNNVNSKMENIVPGVSCIVSFPAFSALFIVGVFECVIQTFTLSEVQGCEVPANYIYNGYKTVKLPLNDLSDEYSLDEALAVQKENEERKEEECLKKEAN